MTEMTLHCPRCGYDLRMLTSDRCPECGLPLAQAQLARSNIPWEHRKTIGRFKAFWRTVPLGLFQPRKLAVNVATPVHYDSAHRFRRACIMIACAGMALALLYIYAGFAFHDSGFRLVGDFFQPSSTSSLISSSHGYAWLFDWVAIAITLFSCYWWMRSATSTFMLFSRSRYRDVIQQNRAVALALYGSAPVFLLLPVAIAFLYPALVFFKSLPTRNIAYLTLILGNRWLLLSAFIALMMVVLLFRNGWILLARTAGRSGIFCTLITPAVILIWLLQTAFFLVVLPVCAFYAALVFGSFV